MKHLLYHHVMTDKLHFAAQNLLPFPVPEAKIIRRVPSGQHHQIFRQGRTVLL